MTDPTRRNRLDEEESPYLRQHADNPVNWQPWDDRALAAARERDVPIFLSVGYAACHWCHVMEEESFEDEGVASLLNDHFVPVKVDREERPDVDSVYMTVCQIVTGQGGWPLSVWLTPEGKPFYVGTYFPTESQRGQPGFRQLLEDVAEAWADPEEREEIEARADQWAAAAAGELEDVPDQPGDPGDDLLERAAEAAVGSADREHGGFGRSQKFPQPRRIDLLLRAHDRTGREAFREVAIESLDAMAGGGLFDHVGGGFHRYCVDPDWTVPHFEKMLYDQAELARAYLAGHQVTGEERYAEVARETFAFVERELRHAEGGLFSTLDAESVPAGDEDAETEEGAFYVWTPETVEAAIEDERRAALFRDRFGVTEAGNFEGRTVLTVDATVAELAEAHDLPPAEVEAELARAREEAFAAREERPRPARDEKVLAGWNGLAISALAEGALVLGDDGYADLATDALGFVRDRLWDGETLHRRFKDSENGDRGAGSRSGGDVAVDGYLEDYAFLARGALDCYQATGDVDHLAFAVELARRLVERFWDAEAGTLYFTPEGGERLFARPQELGDGSTPSSAGVAARTLLELDAFAPDEGFADVAERTVETHAETLDRNPLGHVSLVLAADALDAGVLEVTIVSEALPRAWRDRLADVYLPDRLLAPRPPGDGDLDAWLDALGAAEAPPVWAGRGREGDEPTAYVCRRACSPPLTDVEDALEWAEEFRP